MQTLPQFNDYLNLNWIRSIPKLTTEYAVELTMILISFSVIVAFRHRILYTEYTYDGRRPDNWDKNVSLGDYIDGLLANPRTRKKKLRSYLLNDIYLTEIGGESISLKKKKPATTLFRVCLRVISRFSLWFRHIAVLRPNDDFDLAKTKETESFAENGCIFFEQNHVQVLIRSLEPEFRDLNEKLMDAVLRNLPECKIKASELSNEARPEVFEKIAKPLVQFLRGAGYLYTRKLVTKETNWDNAIFFWTVVGIGLNLDPVLYPIRIHLTQTSSSFTIPIPKPDLVIFEYRTNAFITAEQKAKSQLRAAKEKIKKAREKVQAQLAGSSSQPDSFERTDKLIESLAEENTAEALHPEAFARDSDIAQVFLKSIKTLTGLSINSALQHPLIITCNKFIKVSSKKNLSDFYTPLQRQITAMKLGLTPTHFDQNPGFEDFAKKTHLHRYLFVQGHELEVDSSNRILVTFEGHVLPWEQVIPKLHFENLTGVFSGQYSKDGFVNYGMYDWTELEPFYIEKQLPPSWGNRYLCEVCSWIIDKPRIKGDHTFLRLKTPKGEWYSVGQYEPLKPSRFMSPDVSEYWNGHFTTLAFEITPEQFTLMKEKVEEDKRQQLYPYQVYQSNCTIWAKSIAEVAGLNLPSSLAAADLLTPRLAAFGRKINGLGLTPGWLKSLVKLVFAVSLNCLSLILGSGMVHPNFKSDPNFNSSVPYIHSLKDIFDVNKVVSEHPFVLGNYVRNQVEEWRSSKKQELMDTKHELISKLSSADDSDKEPLQAQLKEIELSLDSIQYAVPPEFKS